MRVILVVLGVGFLLMAFACGGGGSPSPVASQSSSPVQATSAADQEPADQAETAATAPESSEPAPATEPAEPETPEYVVYLAADVYEYYDANELRGDQELKERRFAVTGRVGEINRDILGTPYLAFRSANWMFGVQCMFPRNSESLLTQLNPGDIVTVAGTCSGKLVNVIMTDCQFYTPKQEEPEKKRTRRPPPERPEPVVRTWSDATGQFTIEAEFAGYSSGVVKLKKADGSTLDLLLENLSQADQDWIRSRR